MQHESAERTDVCIIGAGPIGLELAVALRRRGIAYQQVEAGQIGSTIGWFAPYTTFFSSPERIAIAGVPIEIVRQGKPTREEYLAYLRGVVRQFRLEVKTYERVRGIERTDSGFVLRIGPSCCGVGEPYCGNRSVNYREQPERQLSCERLVLAIGSMHEPNRLGVEGENLPHVSHYFEDPHRYFGKRVLIVGGKNSAAEAAIRLYRLGCEVHISYRCHALDAKEIKYWIYPELRHLIGTKGIRFHPSTAVARIEPGRVSLVRADEAQPVPAETVEADFVLLLTGYRQDTDLFRKAGVDLEGPQAKPVHNKETMETNVRNLYVAGTAVGGTQVGAVKEFIETGHAHVDRIIGAFTGTKSLERTADLDFLES